MEGLEEAGRPSRAVIGQVHWLWTTEVDRHWISLGPFWVCVGLGAWVLKSWILGGKSQRNLKLQGSLWTGPFGCKRVEVPLK